MSLAFSREKARRIALVVAPSALEIYAGSPGDWPAFADTRGCLPTSVAREPVNYYYYYLLLLLLLDARGAGESDR